jgi:hypothetical protein
MSFEKNYDILNTVESFDQLQILLWRPVNGSSDVRLAIHSSTWGALV